MPPRRILLLQLCEAWVRLSAFSLLVFLPLVVSPWDPDAFSRPKALVLYALTSLMVLGWLVSYLIVRRPSWRVTDAEFPVWILGLTLLLSTWATADAVSTFLGAPGRREGVVVFVSYIVLFLAGVHYFGSRRNFRLLATVLAMTSFAVIAYGMIRVWLPPLFAAEGQLQEFYSTVGFKRILSLIGSPITYGGYLSFVTPLFASLYLVEQRESLSWAWLVGSVLALVSTLLTMTRGAWIAVLLGGLVFLAALGGPGVWAYRRRLAALLAFAAAAMGILAVAVMRAGVLYQRATSAFDLRTGSTAQHLYIWGKTIELIRERPLLGWGLETLGRVFPYDRQELVQIFGLRPVIIDRAHNDVLHVAVSIGVPGAVAYAAFWILVLVSGVRLARWTGGEARVLVVGFLAALVGYLVQAQFSFSSVAVTPLVWLLAGSVVGWEAAADGQ